MNRANILHLIILVASTVFVNGLSIV